MIRDAFIAHLVLAAVLHGLSLPEPADRGFGIPEGRAAQSDSAPLFGLHILRRRVRECWGSCDTKKPCQISICVLRYSLKWISPSHIAITCYDICVFCWRRSSMTHSLLLIEATRVQKAIWAVGSYLWVRETLGYGSLSRIHIVIYELLVYSIWAGWLASLSLVIILLLLQGQFYPHPMI